MEFTGEELQLFDFFSKQTGVEALDLERTEYGLVFLVSKENLGRAIGKNGATIERLRKSLRQNTFIYADSDQLEEFVRNLFNNVSIENIEVREAMGDKAVFLTVAEKDRGIAIGKEGQRIKVAKLLLKKKFNSTISIKTRRAVI